jgi:hypothetical protein
VLPVAVTIACCVVVLVAVAFLAHRVGHVQRRVESLPRSEDLQQLVASASNESRIGSLEEGVRRLADQIIALPAPLDAKDLVPVQERLEELARTVTELRHYVDDLRTRMPVGSDDHGSGTRLLRALEQRGFESIHILGELSDESGEQLRVPVEARRGGMSFKGFVSLEDGRLTEVALKPVTEVFP